MKLFNLITLLIFANSLVISQNTSISFSKKVGGDQYDIFSKNCVAHNYLWSVGYSESDNVVSPFQKVGNMKAWIYACDHNGDSVLNKFISGSGTNYATDIIEGGVNNVIVVGVTNSTDGDFSGLTHYGSRDAFLAVVDTLGNIMHISKYGGSNDESVNRIIRTNNDGFLLIGSSDSNDGLIPGIGTPDTDGWVYRLSSTLEQIWSKKIGFMQEQSFYDGVSTADNGFILVGTAEAGKDAIPNFWVIKINSVGDTQWELNHGGSDVDIATGIYECSDGNFMAYGLTNSDNGGVHDHIGLTDGHVLKFTPEGDTLWSKSLGWSDSYQIISDIFEYNNKYYAVMSSTYSTEIDHYGQSDIVIVEFDQFTQQFVNNFGGEGIEPYTEDSKISVQELNGQLLFTSSSNSHTHDLPDTLGMGDGWIFGIDFITAIENNKFQRNIDIYPNPADNYISFSLSAYETLPLKANITDINGKMIKNISIEQDKKTIDISNIKSGIYIIEFENQYIRSKKFIKL
jgi:hypothetical protein